LLVPKNHHVRTALAILRSSGIPVSSSGGESFFDAREIALFRHTLAIVANPNDTVSLAASLFDETSQIGPLVAHAFFRSHKTRALSLDDLLTEGDDKGLFAGENPIAQWGKQLALWVQLSNKETISTLIATVGNELLIHRATDHDAILVRSEAVRSMLHLALAWEGSYPHKPLGEFLVYLDRLESYHTHIPLATFGAHRGVSVMTLHASKGLEFQSVWVAHMNEETLMSSRRGGFVLPEKVAEKVEEKNMLVAKREVYVAITRAKKYCTISHAVTDYKGTTYSLARIIAELPPRSFIKKDASQTETELLALRDDVYTHVETIPKGDAMAMLSQLVTEEYDAKTISVTLLNNFFECPWKWYFRNFLALPDVKSDYLALGSAVHSAIEFILKNGAIPSEEEIHTVIVASFAHEGLADERTMAKLVADAMATTMHWIKVSYGELAPNHESERSLSYRDPRFPHLSLYGKIDLTERFPDGTVSVTDFKTGSSKTTGVIEKLDEENRLSSYLRQLAMYTYLIQGGEKGRDVISSKLYFLEADKDDKNRIYQTRINAEHIDLLVRDITDYDKALRSGEWINRSCYFKPYGSGSTECEHCTLARRVYKK